MFSFFIHFGIQIDWAANIRKSWDFNEEGAHARLDAFLHDGEKTLHAHGTHSVER